MSKRKKRRGVRDPVARALADPKFRKRIVKDKKREAKLRGKYDGKDEDWPIQT